MLRIDSDVLVEDQMDLLPARVTAPPARRAVAIAAAPPLPGAYQPSRQFDWLAALGAGATVAAMLAGFVWIRVAPALHEKRDLMVLNLPVTPPPAAHIVPRPRPQVEPHRVQPISVPPPIVTIAAPSPVATTPAPAPPPVVLAPPAPPAAPAAAAAAPAPAATPTDGGDLSSRMIAAKPPSYPIESRRKKEEGTVVLTVLLDTQGRVADIAVSQSSGFDRLDHAALGAVRDWRWSPVVRNGAPVMVQGRVRIPFVIKR